ncbi:MAG: Zn-dependent hydrolase [Rhodospirillales bacterium]|nr:Zn-dependent hydrolase [Rhodospirillales bacterium]
MTAERTINAGRLLRRLQEFGQIGRTPDGALARVALTDADKSGRDAVVRWMKAIGMAVEIDAIGNIFGTWGAKAGSNDDGPVMVGSHIDTVINAGIYDGNYGVLAGLEVVATLREAGVTPSRPITVAVFTNEEGIRYAPDMMGSLVHVGGLALDAALATVGNDGTTLGGELVRIGYAGRMPPGTIRPHVFVELHIEQGPILEHEGYRIGSVENLQGISWQKIAIRGQANHAGTTPMRMRRDAGYAAARIVTFVNDHARSSNGTTVSTVGTIKFEPNVINVIPARATLTVDLRDTDETRLKAAEAALSSFLATLSEEIGVTIDTERLARFEPVVFDVTLVALIDEVAVKHGLRARRMTSGAGHDAQMMSRIAPAAMIFVPSEKGISHNPREHTSEEDLVAGANVLLDVVSRLAGVDVS